MIYDVKKTATIYTLYTKCIEENAHSCTAQSHTFGKQNTDVAVVYLVRCLADKPQDKDGCSFSDSQTN